MELQLGTILGETSASILVSVYRGMFSENCLLSLPSCSGDSLGMCTLHFYHRLTFWAIIGKQLSTPDLMGLLKTTHVVQYVNPKALDQIGNVILLPVLQYLQCFVSIEDENTVAIFPVASAQN